MLDIIPHWAQCLIFGLVGYILGLWTVPLYVLFKPTYLEGDDED